jgi:Raf kinase inhibitor-like YbhB/YbcL family protein
MQRMVLGLLVVGCGSDPAMAPDAASGPDCTVDPVGPLSLTSPSFASCAAIPAVNGCAGANTSPPLAWTGAPAGTQSFAIVFTDLSISLVHWVIFDIPATSTALPAAVERAYAPGNVAGAHQTTGYDGNTRGYLGPCPPSPHTYQLALYALDVVALPDASLQTTRAQAADAIMSHQLATATLTGTFSP